MPTLFTRYSRAMKHTDPPKELYTRPKSHGGWYKANLDDPKPHTAADLCQFLLECLALGISLALGVSLFFWIVLSSAEPKLADRAFYWGLWSFCGLCLVSGLILCLNLFRKN
jgi:hypothetical protein